MVRTKNNLTQWLSFFLVGIKETAESAINSFVKILKLRKELEEKKISKLGKRIPLAMELLNHLYSKPVVDANEVAKVLDVNISTAHRLLIDFEKLKILKEKTGFRRNRIFVFEPYLELFKK